MVPDAEPRPSDPGAGDADGLRRALAPVHRRYAGIIHARRKRFGCVAMDENISPRRCYVSLNSVRARLVDGARGRRWSSVRAHLGGRGDGVTTLARVHERYQDFTNFLSSETDAEMIERLRSAEAIGRPLGPAKFLDMLERKTKRILKPGKAGPKPRNQES